MMVRRRPRALAAVILLAAMGFGIAEAVAGELADASEHYEDVTSVVHEHSDTNAGGACLADLQQDTEGQHLKGYDHCTHAHGLSVGGTALPTPSEYVVPEETAAAVAVRPPEPPTFGLYHPPKA